MIFVVLLATCAVAYGTQIFHHKPFLEPYLSRFNNGHRNGFKGRTSNFEQRFHHPIEFRNMRYKPDNFDYEIMPEISNHFNEINVPDSLKQALAVNPDLRDQISLTPSLRDKEYLSHSSLFGNPLRNSQNVDRLRTYQMEQDSDADDALPSYCNPPNPCPVGYTEADGCLEEFENTAGFSRDYQASQDCLCDSEHMFQCPMSSADSDISVLANSIQNHGGLDSNLDNIIDNMKPNPFMNGEKLPVAAKKGNVW